MRLLCYLNRLSWLLYMKGTFGFENRSLQGNICTSYVAKEEVISLFLYANRLECYMPNQICNHRLIIISVRFQRMYLESVEFSIEYRICHSTLNLFWTLVSDWFILVIIIWLCLTRTGNCQIHEFDWLKWILTAVQIFPSRPASRSVMFWSEKVAN